jgi:hypothetical protein
MSRKLFTVVCSGLTGVALLATAGCGANPFPQVNVEVPDAAQFVLDNAADFIAAANDPLETTDPGTVIDDLDTLDGCWGTVFTNPDVESPLSVFSVYQFDAADQTYVSWSFIGNRDTGALWALMPLFSEESGTYEVTGEATIEMTVTRMRANTDADGTTILATLQDLPLDGQRLTRPALITLDDDQMLIFVDAETAADLGDQYERPIYFKFDCP